MKCGSMPARRSGLAAVSQATIRNRPATAARSSIFRSSDGPAATITAEEETTVIAVTRAELLEGLAADPQAAIALLEILAGRFRGTG